ncbi:hypothetical protein Bbelb_429630 [Branchiostoma belcheri]|nr:hypothetical protein Bbelb_429630 [Branchiostoma belcheri]
MEEAGAGSKHGAATTLKVLGEANFMLQYLIYLLEAAFDPDPKEKVDALGDQFSSVFTEEDLTNIPSLGRPVAPHAPPLYISVIFTQSLDTGDVPADWRAANISPIFKKGDKTSPVNYRPVSLTSVCKHLYAHTWSTVRLYGIPTPSVVPRRWSESNEGRREWLTINEWNKLPGQLVKAQTVEAFKAGLLAVQP